MFVATAGAFCLWLAPRARHSAVSPIASVSAVSAPARASSDALPPPELDLPASRLYERFDGAESSLRSLGCRRLMFWRIADAAADLEVLAFETPEGAAQALARDAGLDRTAGPGEEAWTNGQALYFRRGSIFVRIIADDAAHGDALLARARRLDRALVAGELRP